MNLQDGAINKENLKKWIDRIIIYFTPYFKYIKDNIDVEIYFILKHESHYSK